EILGRLGFGDFTIQLNHRALLSAMLTVAEVPPELHGDALVAIDKLDKIGRDGVVKELVAARGIPAAGAEVCLSAVSSQATFDEVISGHEIARGPRAEIDRILQLVEDTPAAGHVAFVPRLARGLSYYTGAIMEISVPDLAGSLGGGGRYDNLVGMFL